MIRQLFATTALAGALVTGAYAQDSATAPANAPHSDTATPAGATPAATTDTAAPGEYLQALAADQYKATALDGASIYASNAPDAETIGEIQNFLIGDDGKVVAAITDASIGDQSKVVAIPFDKIEWAKADDGTPRAIFTAGADSLAQAPEFTTPDKVAAAADTSSAPATGEASTPASNATGNMAAGSGSASDMAKDTAAATPSSEATSSGEYATAVGADQFLSRNLIGSEVYSGPGDDAQNIGGVDDLVLGSSGDVVAGVVGVGGFLGIGQKDVAVPFEKFQLSRDGDEQRVVLAANKEQLDQAPAFAEDRDAGSDMTASNSAAEKGAAAGAAAGNAIDSASDRMATAADTTGDTMSSAADKAKTAVSDAADATGNAIERAAQATRNAVDNAGAELTRNDASTRDTAAAGGAAANGGDTATADTQTTASTGGTDRASGLTEVTDQSQLTADNLLGATVHGPSDTTVGEIGDIVLDPKGKIDALIVDVGGFLGIGAKPVAVAMENLTFMQDANGKLSVDTQFTEEQLSAAPEYKADAYADNRSTMRLENTPASAQSSNAGSGDAMTAPEGGASNGTGNSAN